MNMEGAKKIERAMEKALERWDYILETIPTPDFVEIVGRAGGDTATYRVYDDGSVYKK